MKRLLPVLAVLALCLGVLPVGAGNQNVKKFMLFNGTNAAAQDSNERFSPWIPIKGATRIYLRTWSAGATADTDFCDTITTWKTLFSDSVLFIGRDSLGTLVTAWSTVPTTSSHGLPFPVCGDSVSISGRAADSTKMVMVLNPVEGVNKPLRGSGTGSGYWSYIVPAPSFFSGINFPVGVSNTASLATPDVFMTGFMRVRYTPRVRATSAGSNSTQGIRTRGPNRLKVEAYVVYPNQ